ncbi:hypothetical protein C5167_040820 [Papaver somniferum]|uniref:Uncharacterized protein n=1 Tax=Papaver somniferum TaxID=3469 RepID=A0A4Y7IK93_PAPSO|nr:hypothetical protein C5167_040820 [Papaver somniferum]
MERQLGQLGSATGVYRNLKSKDWYSVATPRIHDWLLSKYSSLTVMDPCTNCANQRVHKAKRHPSSRVLRRSV